MNQKTPVKDITVKELKSRLDAKEAPKIIDVRETWEYEQGHIQAENIPMATIPVNLARLEGLKNEEIVVCCRSGGRSGQIKMFLEKQGFGHVRNLTGGMIAWKAEIDPTFKVE